MNFYFAVFGVLATLTGLLIVFFNFIFKILKDFRPDIKKSEFLWEYILFILNIIIVLLAFIVACNPNDYYDKIDPGESSYTSIASKHKLTILVYFILNCISQIFLWLKQKNMPPLQFVILNTFLIIWEIILIFINAQVLLDRPEYESNDGGEMIFTLYFIINTFTLILFWQGFIFQESDLAKERHYKNKLLNFLNTKISESRNIPFYIILFILPIFVLITLILILFGQNATSIIDAFTETTTWHFSQKTPPPYLDHRGHYLCTVAACGSPSIVKPYKIGKRHGHKIIVNRQLQIANAFEDLIQQNTPKLHEVIREYYDKYGFPLSKYINSSIKSNIIYLMMKPIEWSFLVILYLFSTKPEERINQQYQ